MPKRKKRKDRHQIVLDGIANTIADCVTVQLHTKSVRYMPRTLKGVPDLIVSTPDFTLYCEIKPLYEKSRRDTLNEEQTKFALDIYPQVGKHLRYWIVKDAEEFIALWGGNTHWYVPEYHQRTMEKYR
jgi:hypothetical protein